MSLITVATILIPILLAQSSGVIIRDFLVDTLPTFEFTYTPNQNINDTLILIAAPGNFGYVYKFNKTTNWTFNRTNDVSITQKQSLQSLYGKSGVQAIAGVYLAQGFIKYSLQNATFNLTLTAKGAKNCTLQANITLPTGSFYVSKLYLNSNVSEKVAEAFEAPEVMKRVKGTLWQVLIEALRRSFEVLVARVMATELDTAALCKEILGGTPENYPHPQL